LGDCRFATWGIWKGECREKFAYVIRKYTKYKKNPFCMLQKNEGDFGVDGNVGCGFVGLWGLIFLNIVYPTNEKVIKYKKSIKMVMF
jgi:hypothetical protein